MKALIIKNRVAQVVKDGEEFPVHSSMQWVACSDQVQAGWIYENNAFTESPEVIAERERKENTEYKRQQEMPSLEQKVEALLDAAVNTNSIKLQDVIAKINEVKEKYPE